MESGELKIKGGTEYRKVQVPGTQSPADSEADSRWWLLTPERAAVSISGVLESWSQSQRERRDRLVRDARAYQNAQFPMWGISPGRMAAFRAQRGERLSYNVTQSCADTLASKVGRNKIRPYFLSNGGDYKAQRKARERNQFLSGIFYDTKTDRLARRALVDAIVMGDGIVHAFRRYGRIRHEKVFPLELWWDDYEVSQTSPTQLHRVKAMDVDMAVALWPDKEEAIRGAYERQKEEMPAVSALHSKAHVVFVRESWHLRSAPDARDGVHFFSVASEPLSEMLPWRRDSFPFARLSYCPRLFGEGWAQSGTEQIRSIQQEVDKLLWFTQRSLHLGGTFRWWAKTGSGISVDHLSNQIGAVIRSEEKPEIILSQLVPPEIYAQIRELKQSAYEQFGISQMSATSTKPADLESGESLRVYNDIGAERLSTIALAYEDFHVDIGNLDLAEIQDMLAEQKEKAAEGESKALSYTVKVPRQGMVKKIDLKDMDIEPGEEFVLQVFPISKLPSDPAGRLATVNELENKGMIDPDTAKDLLDFPDLGHAMGLELAQRRYIEKILDGMIDDGEYVVPEPAYDNIPLAVNLAKEYYARSKEQDVPESRLRLLRSFIDDCSKSIVDAQAALGGAPAAGQAPMPPANEPAPTEAPTTQPVAQAAA
jgi:hypothetical protein